MAKKEWLKRENLRIHKNTIKFIKEDKQRRKWRKEQQNVKDVKSQ